MQEAPLLKLEIPKIERVRKLTTEYQSVAKYQLQQATERIKKRLGGLAYKETLAAIEAGDVHKMVELALVYYDKAYAYQLAHKPPGNIISVTLTGTNVQENARKILKVMNEKLKQQY
jgi:tRNA 2-selenouridine synthase